MRMCRTIENVQHILVFSSAYATQNTPLPKSIN